MDFTNEIAHIEQTHYRYHLFPGSLQVFFLNFQRIKIKEDFFYRSHSIPEYELIIPVHGTYRCRLDGRPIKLTPGKFLLIAPFQQHQDEFSSGIRFDCFHFLLRRNGEFKEINNLFELTTAPEKQIGKVDSRFIILREMLWDIVKNENFSVNNLPLINSLFQSMFDLCLGVFSLDKINHKFSPHLEINLPAYRLLRVFEKYLSQTLFLEKLCKEMSMSRSALNSLTKKIYSCSPIQAFTQYKMTQARILFESQPELSIKEIALRLGFSDQFTFSRAFHHHMKMSPIAAKRMVAKFYLNPGDDI